MFDCQSSLNLREILHKRAVNQGDKAAFTFLPDEGHARSLTYDQLYRQARRIGGALRTLAEMGDRALLVYPSGLEYVAAFFGCICAGIIGVPVYPPRKNANSDRLLSIMEDCQAELILTIEKISNYMRSMPQMNGSNPLQLLNTDKLMPDDDLPVDDWKEPEISGETIAFLQYTSGSTASPKGVMVSHSNLMHNLAVIQEVCEQSEGTVLVSWLPIYHDMGLIGNILSTIYVGGHCVFMSPSSFIQKPVRWLDAVSHYRGTYSAAPNFAYELCVEKVTEEEKLKLDLSSWKVTVNGAEPVRPDTEENFLRAFAPAGFDKKVFRPAYGLAEGTLVVTCSRQVNAGLARNFDAPSLEQNRVVEVAPTGAKDQRVLVSCGCGASDQKIAIVDPESLERCGTDAVGEIWISSPSVCQGYWRKPELSESIFRARIRDTGEGPFLRTGDLGFLHEGNLYITGRLKDLIIIRGRNHYPQDIELTAEQGHPAIRPGCGAAFSVEVGGEEHLAIVYEIRRSEVGRIDLEEVADKIRSAVAERHELDVFAIEFVKPGNIPKTSSGKIQRSLCRKNFMSCAFERLEQNEAALTADKHEHPSYRHASENSRHEPMQFSLFYFSSNEAEFQNDKYRLFLDGAKFADEHNFAAVWIPERHFHPFGGIFPNPSVLASALAMTTRRIRIRAGSVVLPLHNPIRVAEEWSVVDNLSGGRVDLAFARGWNPNDFVLAPANYQNSLQALYRGLNDVRKLWQGGAIAAPNGKGEQTEVRIHPQPKQHELAMWITCNGGIERFIEAGAGGCNVLTALLFQPVEELAGKIAAYREARARNGHDSQGHVTLMLHTFMGTDANEVKQTVRKPFIEYLRSSADLWRHGMSALNELTPQERQDALEFAFERYYLTSGLFGTPETCMGLIEQLKKAGVDEIACLIDFGVETEQALRGLYALHWLQEKCRASSATTAQVRMATPHGMREPRVNARYAAAGIHSNGGTQVGLADIPEKQSQDVPDEDLGLKGLIRQVVANAISRATRADIKAIPSSRHFLSMGLNSLRAMGVVSEIEEQFGFKIPYSLLFEFPTVDSLAQVLVREYRDQLIARM